MGENDQWRQCLIYDGRGVPQDFVTRSCDISDIICYLRAERDLEILKLTSFVTKNLISFEKVKVSRLGPNPSLPEETTVEASRPDSHE